MCFSLIQAPARGHISGLPRRRACRGAGALGTVVVLLALATLATLGLGRTLWTDQRALAAQVRGIQAQEAAQFGLDRAWGVLHHAADMGADCRAAPGAGRDRLAGLWRSAAAGSRPVLACVRQTDGWACVCPEAALPAPTPSVADAGEAVLVDATPLDPAHPQAGLRLRAVACSEGGLACTEAAGPGAAGRSALAHLVMDLAPRPALAAMPAAAIVAGGAIRAGSAASDGVQVVNADPRSHGLVVHAGAEITAPASSLVGLPGLPAAWAVADRDRRLQYGDTAQRLTPWLGIAPDRWAEWPRVGRLACGPAGCDGRAVEALLRQGHRAVHVDGDLRWDAPQGPGEPFVLVVAGTLRLEGPGLLEAVLVAHGVQARHADPNAPLQVRGAVISAGDVELAGQVRVVRDPEVLDAARQRAVALGRLPGGWRDLPAP